MTTKKPDDVKTGEPPSLRKAYEAMNDAVCAGYGWPRQAWRDPGGTLGRLLALNRDLASKGRLDE